MMERRESIACAAAFVAMLGAGLRIARSADLPPPSTAPSFVLTPRIPVVDDDSLGQAAANTAANDPFRLANRPSTVRYDARSENIAGGVAMQAFTPPKPQLILKAIIGGPPWQAIVDGIPGQQPGTIVRSNNTFDKLTVRSVGRDTVTIVAPDTTWKLTLRRDRP